MGDMIIENSKSEKYLGDQIHEDGCAASITATLDGRIPSAIDRGEIIINTINHPALLGHRVAIIPVEQFESKISSDILLNRDSWTNQATHRQNTNCTRKLLQESFPSSRQRHTCMHGQTRQPNTSG